jgi:glycosyltransferase involved in cell wall biosynthesis
MESRPALSVIVPVHNGERFLAEAIESVLAQRHPGLEILVIDDGSTDATPELALAMGAPVRHIRQENRGPSAARNTGIRHAQADLVTFLDADDRWTADMLALLLPALEDGTSADIAMGYTQPMDAGMQQTLMAPRLAFAVSACLFRRSAFERFGLFDESIRLGEDLDWLLRAREAGGRIALVNGITLLYRQNPGSASFGKNAAELNLFRILKRSVERRREDDGALAPLEWPE